jgi:nucleotide-binding universal stress UspA family protein
MFIHPKHILWPTDLSPLSLKAAEYARVFTQTFGANLHVLHVAPALVFNSTTAIMTGGDAAVGTIDTVTHPHHITVASQVVVGEAWYEVCRYARDHTIDLIILATHGRTGFKHVLMGSTAERVVRHASCPVLTVKSFEREFIEFETGDTSPTV